MKDMELVIRNYAEKNPIVVPQRVSEVLQCSRQTASKYLHRLTQKGFLREVHVGGIRIFVLEKLFRDFENEKEVDRE